MVFHAGRYFQLDVHKISANSFRIPGHKVVTVVLILDLVVVCDGPLLVESQTFCTDYFDFDFEKKKLTQQNSFSAETFILIIFTSRFCIIFIARIHDIFVFVTSRLQ